LVERAIEIGATDLDDNYLDDDDEEVVSAPPPAANNAVVKPKLAIKPLPLKVAKKKASAA